MFIQWSSWLRRFTTLISIITWSLYCRFIISQTQLSIFLRIFLPKWQMKATSIHAQTKSKCSRVLKNWHWHDFQTQRLLVQYVIFFGSSIVTTFRGLDGSLCSSVFHTKVGLILSVLKNGTSDYTCQKYSENNSKHALICNKKSYICKWPEMICRKVKVLGYYNKFRM